MTDAVRVFGQTLITTALYEGIVAKGAENHELRMAAIMDSRPAVDSSDHERDKKNLKSSIVDRDITIRSMSEKSAANQKTIADLSAELVERDRLLNEWMHSNEAFKRLAKDYGKKLGINNSEIQTDLNLHIEAAAEEDPRFQNTGVGKLKTR